VSVNVAKQWELLIHEECCAISTSS